MATSSNLDVAPDMPSIRRRHHDEEHRTQPTPEFFNGLLERTTVLNNLRESLPLSGLVCVLPITEGHAVRRPTPRRTALV